MTYLKPKFIVPLALLLGMVAVYSTHLYLQQKEKEIEETDVELKNVVVAAANLATGTSLNASDIVVTQWPEDIIPKGTFERDTLLIGRVIKTDLSAKEVITEAKLAPVGSTGGFSSIIPPGMRALTVAVNVVSGVSGFILPKTFVDVLVTVMPSAKKENATTKIILEDIEVLAVDQDFQREDDDPVTVQSVTLLVTPKDAEKLTLAANEGKLQLALRNSADKLKTAQTSGATLGELIARKSTPPAKPVKRTVTRRPRPAPPVRTVKEKKTEPKVVEVIRASERSEVEFEEQAEEGKNSRGR